MSKRWQRATQYGLILCAITVLSLFSRKIVDKCFIWCKLIPIIVVGTKAFCVGQGAFLRAGVEAFPARQKTIQRKVRERMYEMDLLDNTEDVNRLLARYGVKFGIYKNNTFKEQLFPFDAIPRVIQKEEFDYLERGLKQRVMAQSSDTMHRTAPADYPPGYTTPRPCPSQGRFPKYGHKSF